MDIFRECHDKLKDIRDNRQKLIKYLWDNPYIIKKHKVTNMSFTEFTVYQHDFCITYINLDDHQVPEEKAYMIFTEESRIPTATHISEPLCLMLTHYHDLCNALSYIKKFYTEHSIEEMHMFNMDLRSFAGNLDDIDSIDKLKEEYKRWQGNIAKQLGLYEKYKDIDLRDISYADTKDICQAIKTMPWVPRSKSRHSKIQYLVDLKRHLKDIRSLYTELVEHYEDPVTTMDYGHLMTIVTDAYYGIRYHTIYNNHDTLPAFLREQIDKCTEFLGQQEAIDEDELVLQ